MHTINNLEDFDSLIRFTFSSYRWSFKRHSPRESRLHYASENKWYARSRKVRMKCMYWRLCYQNFYFIYGAQIWPRWDEFGIPLSVGQNDFSKHYAHNVNFPCTVCGPENGWSVLLQTHSEAQIVNFRRWSSIPDVQFCPDLRVLMELELWESYWRFLGYKCTSVQPYKNELYLLLIIIEIRMIKSFLISNIGLRLLSPTVNKETIIRLGSKSSLSNSIGSVYKPRGQNYGQFWPAYVDTLTK